MGMMELRRQIISDGLQIKELSGNPVVFVTDMPTKMLMCEVTFSPVQSGSGDPSPSNIRQISGVNNLTITINGTQELKSLGSTYYGGTLNLLTGELIIDKMFVHVNESNFSGISAGSGAGNAPYRAYTGKLSGVKEYKTADQFPTSMICDKLTTISENSWYPKVYGGFINETSRLMIGVPAELSTLNAVKDWVQSIGGFDLVTGMANPIQLQLSGSAIVIQKGQNTIESSNGTVSVKFYTH